MTSITWATAARSVVNFWRTRSIGLVRERAVKERMSVYPELATAMPRDLINAKPVIAAIFEPFRQSAQPVHGSDQPALITHKRRLSALGPGGLSRERRVRGARRTPPLRPHLSD